MTLSFLCSLKVPKCPLRTGRSDLCRTFNQAMWTLNSLMDWTFWTSAWTSPFSVSCLYPSSPLIRLSFALYKYYFSNKIRNRTNPWILMQSVTLFWFVSSPRKPDLHRTIMCDFKSFLTWAAQRDMNKICTTTFVVLLVIFQDFALLIDFLFPQTRREKSLLIRTGVTLSHCVWWSMDVNLLKTSAIIAHYDDSPGDTSAVRIVFTSFLDLKDTVIMRTILFVVSECICTVNLAPIKHGPPTEKLWKWTSNGKSN